MRKWFVIATVGSLAALSIGADAVQAQLFQRRAVVRERRMDRRSVTPTTAVTPEASMVVMPQEVGSTVRVSYYPTPAAVDNVAIRVLLPDAQARVMFDGNATRQVGTERWFYTPPLVLGAANSYRVQATFMLNGREVTQERVIQVMPGRTYVLDFTQQR